MANLKPRHILPWMSRTRGGEHAIREFAMREYELVEPGSERRAA